MSKNPFAVGQTVRVVSHAIAGDPHFAKVGQQYDVTSVSGHKYVNVDGMAGTFSVEWFEDAASSSTRPVIDFSGHSRMTAREYAAAADSRILKIENRVTLQAVALGNKVDAYALNAALVEAMSACATRAGQSLARRDLTRKVRYLSHIVQAVLESHADGLPAYETGERSRLLESVKPALAGANQQIEALLAERLLMVAEKKVFSSTLDLLNDQIETQKAKTQEQEDRGDAYSEQVDALNEKIATAVTQGAVLDSVHQEVVGRLATVEVDLDVAAAVIGYALDQMTAETRQRVLGYWDGALDAQGV